MDLYDELGVRKVINGNATLTRLGGSLMPPEVLAAMAAAAQHFVDLDELQEKVGQRIAEWTHNPAAYVSCGAAAGLALSAAACITGLDEAKRARLPYTEGLVNEFIIHRKGRVGYAFAIQQAGGRLVEIGDDDGASAAEMEAAITERTAGVFVFYNDWQMPGQVPLQEQIAIAHRHHLPVIVDAAAQIPPVENLWRFTGADVGDCLGADLALFSGGKGLRGPQSSGLILGRRDLIQACAFNACPRPFIGRPMKAGKEEIVGLMTAVRLALDLDQAQLMQRYEDQVAWVIAALQDEPHVSARRSFPSEAGQPMPRAEIILEQSALEIERDEVLRQLYDGQPAISLAPAGEDGLFVNPQTLSPGQEQVIVERLRQILRQRPTARQGS